MSAGDWDEVKRLAADFQKAQLSSSLQKLSERNCIEIITTLTENKLLDILYTNDGKEYVTPQQLGKEIKDELYMHGGRISLADLAQILNVGLLQISRVVTEIERCNKGYKVILGHLIDRNYVNKIAEDINDKLSQNGQINVTALILLYNLPPEFLQSLVEKELGRTIFGKQDTQDPQVFYTEKFIASNKAIIRGALSAITKPTPLSVILEQCSVPERIFFLILDSLQSVKQVPGVVSGKQSGNSIYVPSIYSKNQTEWTNNFYRQNGYLEYDALTKLGISDPVHFVKSHFPNEKILFLNSVAVGCTITDQLDSNIEEAVATGSYIDIYPVLPSVFNDKDIDILLKRSTEKYKSSIHIFADTVIFSDIFLQTLNKPLEMMAENKAKEFVANGKWIQYIAQSKIKSKSTEIVTDNIKVQKKEERRKKAATGKAGGGSQGRETKTKSTKKKYLHNKTHENESDDEHPKSTHEKIELDIISLEDIKSEVSKNDAVMLLDDLVDEIVSHFHLKLNRHALCIAEQLAQTSKTINLTEIEERLNVLITNIRIYDKGIKHLDKTDQAGLTTYLLKSLGINFVTELFRVATQQNVLQCPENITAEVRQKILAELPIDVKEPFTLLNKSVAGASVEDFLTHADAAMATCCLLLKKYDKKKEKPTVLCHRQALLEQLNATNDPALALHLVTSILFTASTQSALHMSGRHVSCVLSFLQPRLQPTAASTLSKYYDLVLKLLSSSDEKIKTETRQGLEEGLEEIKAIANRFKEQLISDN